MDTGFKEKKHPVKIRMLFSIIVFMDFILMLFPLFMANKRLPKKFRARKIPFWDYASM